MTADSLDVEGALAFEDVANRYASLRMQYGGPAFQSIWEQLHHAMGHYATDPQSTLTKTRMVLEEVVFGLAGLPAGEASAPALMSVLTKDRRLKSNTTPDMRREMHALRDLGNAGPHVRWLPVEALRAQALDGLSRLHPILRHYFETCREVAPEVDAPRERVWYFDDRPDWLDHFRNRHAAAFDIRTFSNPTEFMRALGSTAQDPEARPDVLLIDMYTPSSASADVALVQETESRLEGLLRLERELKGHVDAAWRPYGADVVGTTRDFFSASQLPVAIYTQRGLVLLDDDVIRDLERLNVRWILKKQFDVPTERMMLERVILEGASRRKTARTRILYLEDNPQFQAEFRARHGEAYDIRCISSQGEVLPELTRAASDEGLPHLFLVDLYYPRRDDEEGRELVRVGNEKLVEYHAREDELKLAVRKSFEPTGLMLVEHVREGLQLDLPILIYTQCGLLLLENESMRRLEKHGAGWLLKDRYSPMTEQVKILSHVARWKRSRKRS